MTNKMTIYCKADILENNNIIKAKVTSLTEIKKESFSKETFFMEHLVVIFLEVPPLANM